MVWTDALLDQLGKIQPCGYHVDGPAASEPSALAAMALMANNRLDAALPSLEWLASLQSADGTVGPTADHEQPQWPTSLTVLAWRTACMLDPGRFEPLYQSGMERAIDWIKTAQGKPVRQSDSLSHDTTIPGWPWVLDTHSWVEPTSFHVLALKATGNGAHHRTRDGVRLLRNRLLSDGGANYGNTFVLGQELRPHVQPTGIALLALAGEVDVDDRVERSLRYLEKKLPTASGSSSLSYGLLALAAHGRPLVGWQQLLVRANDLVMARDQAPLKLALLAQAALQERSPLVLLAKKDAA